ncbi:MAG: U32 family peptidase [Oscillospiraceae bacterium]|nr:U32 family peptidase [Oscillospiraceae bacterium]
MSKPELLAPAGSPEALLAALRCGADAVYLGGEACNARSTAHNFSRDALLQAGRACKVRGVKLYVTLNTMLTDGELPQALSLAEDAVAAGADALIVQDLGLMQLLRTHLPQVKIHASTQCSVQTARGMDLLQRLGCSRVVVPRECTRDELAALVQTASIELEAFVHGALCVSVSGQCLMSAALGGRSGNRGNCAQPCRLPFTPSMSLKDLSLLREVSKAPLNQVASLKIEGRQKRPEYVAAAVSVLRSKLDGTPSPVSEDELRQTFSRSGFTQGYYHTKRDREMFGARQKEDLASAELLRGMRRLYEKEVACVPVDMLVTCAAGQPIRLTVTARGHSVTVQGEVPAASEQGALDEATLRQQLTKLGGTVFAAREISVALGEGLWLPVRAINALRRAALGELEDALAQIEPRRAGGTPYQICADGTAASRAPMLWLRFNTHAQMPAGLPAGARIFLPCETAPDVLRQLGAQVSVPAGVFGAHEAVLQQLHAAKAAGAQQAMAHTLDGVALALAAGLTPIAGEGMNLCNRASLAAVIELGVGGAVVSNEITPSGLRNLQREIPVGAMVYGRQRLMLVRQQQPAELVDRKGIKFPVCMRGDCAEVVNSRPLWLADMREKLPAMDFAVMSFTTESREECAHAIAAWARGEACGGEFTRGWFK